jgi:hypothetical protein
MSQLHGHKPYVPAVQDARALFNVQCSKFKVGL